MSIIVHNYGGTSMGSVERIKNVARRVAKWHAAGHQVVVVPSAMSGETNRLLGLARELSTEADGRELDAIAATGEQASSGLLAIALQAEGLKARSYAGWQVPIRTDSAYTKARITSIDDARIRQDLDAGYVVVVTGFQGVDELGNITTLGRGGSDTSAVAVAAAAAAAPVVHAQHVVADNVPQEDAGHGVLFFYCFVQCVVCVCRRVVKRKWRV